MQLQDLFNTVVMTDEPVSLVLPSAAVYNSLRAALLRKFSGYRATCQKVGIASYDDKFVSCSYDKTTLVATFALKWKEEGKRVRPDYQVFKL